MQVFSRTCPNARRADRRQGLHRVLVASIVTLGLAIMAHLAQGAMNLPDGIEHILGFVPKSSFQCERDGYFGDTDNDCRIFHLCQKQVHTGGRVEWQHWTYACGNQTMFNQLTLTCAFVDEAIPCRHASQFQYLNEVIHKPREPFLTDADVTSGISYYSNRIMSDGARARAFEDSRLLAQLGGPQIGGSEPQDTITGVAALVQPIPSQLFIQKPKQQPKKAIIEQPKPVVATAASLQVQPAANPRIPEASVAVAVPLVSSQPLAVLPVQSSFPVQPVSSVQSNIRSEAQSSFDFSITTDHKQTLQPALPVSLPASSASLPALPALSVLPPLPVATLGPLAPPTTTVSTLRQQASPTTGSQAVHLTTPSLTFESQTLQTQQPRSSQAGRQWALTSVQQGQQRRPTLARGQQQQVRPIRSQTFQSTRISQQQQQLARSPEPAILMRRQQQNQHPQPVNMVPSSGLSLPDSSGGHWPRAFEVHFMGPRFESLLVRRRV